MIHFPGQMLVSPRRALVTAAAAVLSVLATARPALAQLPEDPAGEVSTTRAASADSAHSAGLSSADSLRSADEHTDIRLFEAQTYLEEKNYAPAVDILEHIVTGNPSRVDVWETLARAYQLWMAAVPDAPRELVDQAVRTYVTILGRQPGNRVALDGLKLLGSRYTGPVEAMLKDPRALAAWQAAETEIERQLARPEKQRDFTGAVNSYREALRIEPRHPAMFVHLARVLAMASSPSAEIRHLYETALSINPADLDALNGLAAVHISVAGTGKSAASGGLEEAEHLLETALELEDMSPPDSAGAAGEATRRELGEVLDVLAVKTPTPERHFYLGRLHLDEGNYDEAAKALRTAADLDTSRIEYRKYLAIALFDLNRYDESLGYFQQVVERDAADPDALFHIGSILYDLEHFEEAIIDLERVAEVPRYRARAARLLGLALNRIDSHSDSAIFYLERALREGADDPSVHCVLGEEYLRLERWEEARARFAECLRDRPDHAAGLLGAGLVADHDGRYAEAIGFLEHFLVGHPDSPAVMMRLGLCELRLERPDSAATRFRQAIAADSVMAGLETGDLTTNQVLELGFMILMAGRNLDDGIVVGEYLARTSPEDPGYANNLAMAYADADRNLERALELSQKANGRSPRNAGFLDTLGWTYVRLKRYKDARRTLDRAVEIELAEKKPNPSEIYYHLGFLCAEMDRNKEAIEYLRKTLENPANPLIEDSARKLLSRLQDR